MEDQKHRERERDSEAVFSHLSHLPTLAVIAGHLEHLANLAKARAVKAHTVPGLSLDTDHSFKFDDTVSIYIDNTTNSSAISLQLDNIPLYFYVPASEGRFFPCAGAKQFRISGTVASGSVNAYYSNQPMPYN